MSALIRFSTGTVRYKARMFEQGSRKQDCVICKNRRFGVLVRFIEPKKCESGICHECIGRIAFDLPLTSSEPVKTEAPPCPAVKKPVRAKKKLFKKLKGQHNVRNATKTQEEAGNAGQCQN